VGYYFKLILAMYSKPANETRTGTPVLLYTVAIYAALLTIAMGLFPQLVLGLL
jgi:NADH-quinone oxidoreductase subunit N